MDFLKNAAKIAEQVQAGKQPGGGSGGYGELLSGFMGGGGDNPKPKPKPKPRRDDEEEQYDEERPPHASSQPSSSSAQHKKPSTGELFSSAQVRGPSAIFNVGTLYSCSIS
jgi:hypothetical protein